MCTHSIALVPAQLLYCKDSAHATINSESYFILLFHPLPSSCATTLCWPLIKHPQGNSTSCSEGQELSITAVMNPSLHEKALISFPAWVKSFLCKKPNSLTENKTHNAYLGITPHFYSECIWTILRRDCKHFPDNKRGALESVAWKNLLGRIHCCFSLTIASAHILV